MADNAVRVKDAAGTWVDLAYIATGPQGPAGPGVAGGGSAGQWLVKNSATNYDTAWANPAAGGVLSGTYPNPGMAAGAAKTNLGMSWGTATATFVSVGSSGVSGNVAHGLGSTPANVQATARPTADSREDYVMTVKSRDVTNLVFAVRAAAGEQFAVSAGTQITFDWLAIK